MSSLKIKIQGDLLDKAKKCAEVAGYSSTEEFITHMIEKEVGRILGGDDGDTPESKELVKKRLQGLGYID